MCHVSRRVTEVKLPLPTQTMSGNGHLIGKDGNKDECDGDDISSERTPMPSPGPAFAEPF